MDSRTRVDIAIVGAGAAGLCAAIFAKTQDLKRSPSVLLLNKTREPGLKIILSGGSRCNLTNADVNERDYEGGSKHFIRHVLSAFSKEKTLDFFKALGVECICEKNGKFFPKTQSGKTVLAGLQREIHRRGVMTRFGCTATRLQKTTDGFMLSCSADRGAAESIYAQRVILATGGLSYPKTGSDGQGYRLAASCGHTLVDRVPALTPWLSEDRDWARLQGISLPVRLAFYRDHRKSAERFGPLLFTHFGFSGPVVLDLSRTLAYALDKKAEVRASFVTEKEAEALIRSLTCGAESEKNKKLKNVISAELPLPRRFVDIFLTKCGLDGEKQLRDVTKKEADCLKRQLLDCPLAVSGVAGYEKAEVTAGGVALQEVHHATMESKITPGLFLAGEMLDVDGRLGGFNLQWAWSSGAVAGLGAARSLAVTA